MQFGKTASQLTDVTLSADPFSRAGSGHFAGVPTVFRVTDSIRGSLIFVSDCVNCRPKMNGVLGSELPFRSEAACRFPGKDIYCS